VKIRPVTFMDNFATCGFHTFMLSMMKSTLPGDRPPRLVAAEGIGAVVATAFAAPETYFGHAIELACDAVTRAQAEQVLSRNGLRPALALA